MSRDNIASVEIRPANVDGHPDENQWITGFNSHTIETYRQNAEAASSAIQAVVTYLIDDSACQLAAWIDPTVTYATNCTQLSVIFDPDATTLRDVTQQCVRVLEEQRTRAHV